MRKKDFFKRLLSGLCFLPVLLPGKLPAQSMDMPQFGKHSLRIGKDTLLFDHRGEDGILSGNSDNSSACVHFYTDDPDKRIVLAFEYVDMHDDGRDWPAYIKIYQGQCPDDGYRWPATVSEVNTATAVLPSGQIDSLSGSYGEKTYVDESGMGLSLGFLYRYAARSRGFKAWVRAEEDKPLSVVSAGSSYAYPPFLYAGMQGVNLVVFDVDCEGLSDPDTVTSLRFRIGGDEGVVEPVSIRLYRGASSVLSLSDTVSGALLEKEGGDYVFRFRMPAGMGRTQLSVGASLSGDASAMGKSCRVTALGITTARHVSGYADFVPAGEIPVLEIPYRVLMGNVPATYTVSDTILLYDDGGPDGTIGEGFEGYVTFVPATPEHTVQLDFTMLDLFNTSSTGRNDVFRIYDGRTVDESRINTVLLKEKTARVRSAASDGSLTVYLKSTTGIPKNGFEAYVTEYAVKPMRFLEARQFNNMEETVSAGDSVLLLGINIRTEDLDPALRLESLRLDFSSSLPPETIGGGTLYYMGSDSVFSSSAVSVGEVPSEGNVREWVADNPVGLREGNNYFYLKAALGLDAVDGDKVSVFCSEIVLGDGRDSRTYGIQAVSLEEIPVLNQYLSQEGNFRKIFKNPLSFKPTPTSYSAYDSPTSEQTTTFVPSVPGTYAQMEFSLFDLYASTSVYNPEHDIFQVYSGNRDGLLLWEFTGEENTSGPGKVLRSEASDGALTVLFRPKASSSYYAGKGFDARVSAYVPVPVDIVSANGFQAASGEKMPGGSDQLLLGLRLDVSGTLEELDLESLSVDWKNTGAAVSRACVYLTEDSVFSTVRKIAESTVASDLTSFIPVQAVSLKEGTYYLWLTVDTRTGLPSGTEVDARWEDLSTNRVGDYPIGNADPEGALKLVLQHLLQNGDNGEVRVSGMLMFYDDGGADNPYGKDAFDGRVTFVPQEEGQVIRMRFRQFRTYTSTHKLYVYSGDSVGEAGLMETACNTTYPRTVLASAADDGKMTVRFVHPKASYGAMPFGWEIEVESVYPQPMRIDSLSTETLHRDFVTAGEEDVEIARLRICAQGDTGSCKLTYLDLNLENTTASLYNLRAYFTGTDTSYAVATAQDRIFGKIDSVLPGTVSVRMEGSASVGRAADHYLYLVYDLHRARPGQEIRLRVEGAGGSRGDLPVMSASSTAVHGVRAGIHGDFVIGTSARANYASVQEAVDALKDGVDGPVTFYLEDGVYDEVVVIPPIPGLSSQNLLHITSLSADAQKVAVSSDDYDEYLDYATLTRNPNAGVFNIAGAGHVKLSHLSFTTNNLNFPNVVYAYRAARYLEFSHIRIVTETPDGSDYKKTIDLLGLGASSDVPDFNCDRVRIHDCYFEGGDIGLNLGGSGIVAWGDASKVKYISVENNTFVNQASKSVYLHDAMYLTVRGNRVENNFVPRYGFWAFDFYRSGVGSEISGNRLRIEVADAKTAHGFYFRPVYGTASQPVRIFNNVIRFSRTAGASYGIYLSGGPNTCSEFAHNTVLMGGDAPAVSSAVLSLDDDASPEGCLFANNLFQNHAGGYAYRLNTASDADLIRWESNGVFSASGIFSRLGSEDLSFGQWQAAVPKDDRSLFDSARFLSPELLGLKEAAGFRSGEHLDWVGTDILGIGRPQSGTTLGAYEFEEGLDRQPRMLDGYPRTGRISPFEAEFKVAADQSGYVYVLLTSDTAGTVPVDSIRNKGMCKELARRQELSVLFDTLQANTAYRAFFVLENFNGLCSGVFSTPVFLTGYKPTEVSDFESVETGFRGDFEDGTALFRGFCVKDVPSSEDPNAPEGSHRAVVKGAAEILLTNTDSGLDLKGFFYKSSDTSSIRLSLLEGVGPLPERTFRLPASETWRYFSLRDLGKIGRMEIRSSDSLYLDDFSGEPLPLSLSYLPQDTAVKKGSLLRLEADVLCGVPDYACCWLSADGDTLSQERTLVWVAEKSQVCDLWVRDAWNRSLHASVRVLVHGDWVADFENLGLPSRNNWHGEKDGTNFFYSGMYRFANRYLKEYDSWTGFAYASYPDSEYVPEWGYGNQYKNAAGGGADSSRTYALAYDRAVMDFVGDTSTGVSLEGCRVTNNVMLCQSVLQGDDFVGKPFGTGDYFKMILTAYHPGGDTSRMEYFLADYRDADPDEHYLLQTWEWLDLGGLGAVNRLEFSFDGSRKNAYGLTLPAYAAIDDMNVPFPVYGEVSDSLCEGESQAYAYDDLFALPGKGSWKVSVQEQEEPAFCAVEVGKDSLRVDGWAEGKNSLLLKAVRNGRSRFVRMDVFVKAGSGSSDTVAGNLPLDAGRLQLSLYPVPAGDFLQVAISREGGLLEVFDLQGRRVYSRNPVSSKETLFLSGWKPGVYMLKVSADSRVAVRRFTVVR